MIRWTILLIVLLAAGIPTACCADDDPVESARRALHKSGYPWYDSQEDDVKRLEQKSDEQAAADRASKWSGELKWDGNWWDWNFPDLSAFFAALWQLLKSSVWLFLILLIVLLVWLFGRTFVRAELAAAQSAASTQAVESGSDVDRIEQLPFQVDRPLGDLLSEVRRHYEAGNYRQAVIYLFSYQLVELDKHHLIRLAKGKTNRQYLREVRVVPDLVRIVEHTMVVFEDVFFGDYSLERDRFERCWRELDDFHQQVAMWTA